MARFVSVQGTVEFRRSETNPWEAAALNDALCVGSTVRVGPFSRAGLAFANDSVLRLDQKTTLRLQGEAEERRSLLNLIVGAIHFFSSRPRALEIGTPYMNAAAEGTEFLVEVKTDRTEIIMFEGRVLAQNPDGELRLAAGDAAVAIEGEAPQPQIVARPRDAVAWTLYYPPITAALADRAAPPRFLPPGLQTAVERVAANDYPGALAALEEVPDAARDVRYYTYRAGVLLNVGRVDAARGAIERALALNPEAGEALAQRAIIAIVQNRREEALADARRAVELTPESAAAQIALSYTLQVNFDLEAARDTLRAGAERITDDPLLLARLAELELSFGELDKSLVAAKRAALIAPDLSRAQMVLGFAELTRINIDEAKAAFERAIELDSASPLPRLGLGLAKIRRSDLEEGRNEIQIAAGLDPNNSLIRSYLGKAFFEERRDPLAGDQYAIAKELDPNDPTPWFYDAIRKQLDNRPVEALRDLERSIELNDNRAVFRSRLLLDDDQATRGTSLARIYDDLGFEQLGVLEASRSLSLDPANSSAHRFLSDTYAGEPRQEIGRVSELLQAQLLQPININPVQPSSPFTDLSVVAGAGPAEAAFNEFTPLFERNQLQFTASGVYGNNDILGDELVLSGLLNRLSVSGGQFHSETNGFRNNNDLTNDLYNVFAQFAVTPQLNLQTEYRRRDTKHGDITLNFDPDDFGENERRKLDQDVGRVGLRYSPAQHSDLLASLFYVDRSENNVEETSGIEFGGDTDDQGYQAEGQYLFHQPAVNLVVGGGFYDIDVDQKLDVDFGFGPFRVVDRRFDRQSQKGYAYGNIRIPGGLTWTVGASYDYFEEDKFDRSKVNPKAGLQWDATDWLRLRFAYFRTLKPALSVQQTLEPTQIAGFNQFFDDINGSTAEVYALGLDATLVDGLYGGLEYQHRDVDQPVTRADGSAFIEDRDESLYRAYFNWTPHDRWALSGEVRYEEYDQDFENPETPDKLQTFSVPAAVRYFGPKGLFAEFGVTYLRQKVDRKPGSPLNDGTSSTYLLDAAVGLRLPQRYGIFSLEVRNLLDESFEYQDLNFLTSERRASPLIPQRTIMGRLTLNF